MSEHFKTCCFPHVKRKENNLEDGKNEIIDDQVETGMILLVETKMIADFIGELKELMSKIILSR